MATSGRSAFLLISLHFIAATSCNTRKTSDQTQGSRCSQPGLAPTTHVLDLAHKFLSSASSVETTRIRSHLRWHQVERRAAVGEVLRTGPVGASASNANASMYCCKRRLTVPCTHTNVELIVASSLVEDVYLGMHFVPSSILPPDRQLLGPLGKPSLRVAPVLEHVPTDGQRGGPDLKQHCWRKFLVCFPACCARV